MKIRNEHWHGGEECLLLFKELKTHGGRYYKNFICAIHFEECCRCGWGWGYHSKDRYTEV